MFGQKFGLVTVVFHGDGRHDFIFTPTGGVVTKLSVNVEIFLSPDYRVFRVDWNTILAVTARAERYLLFEYEIRHRQSGDSCK